jgi:hypothetical protein
MLQVSPDVIVLLLYFEGISRLMILDLEAEKAVDSSKRLVMSGYSQLRTGLGIFGLIGESFRTARSSAGEQQLSMQALPRAKRRERHQ